MRTQIWLAEQLGVHPDTLRHWEQGKKLPGYEMPDKIFAALKLTLSQKAELEQSYLHGIEEKLESLRQASAPRQPAGLCISPPPSMVGRETESHLLQRWLAQALGGELQIVFVTGELGMGKTAVVDTFLARLPATEDLWLARGQCVAKHGGGEPYRPVLEALEQLCQGPGGPRLLRLLGQYAPTWLMQMPRWLLSEANHDALQRSTLGATPERMCRELAKALGVLTTATPLVLVLEDLHWSDPSTLDLIAELTQQQDQARLLLIGTYRPAEVSSSEHPLETLVGELQTHRQCEELALDALPLKAVVEYLTARFPRNTLPTELAQLIYQGTEGHPLFMVDMVEDCIARGLLVEGEGQWKLKGALETVQKAVPKNERQMIQRWIRGRGQAQQKALEVGSVAGMEFSAAAVAAGLEVDVPQAEEWLEGVERGGRFLTRSGEVDWPDGTVAARYHFMHSLYQTVLYDGLTAARRRQVHQRIGKRMELGYGERVGEIAAELAAHFEEGREYWLVVRYREQAAKNALRRAAYKEAVDHLTTGLSRLRTLPDTFERTLQELALQITLGPALMATMGYAASEVLHAYARARELCRQVGQDPQLFLVLRGLWVFYLMRAEHKTALELGEELLRLAQSVQDPTLLLQAHMALGSTCFRIGELTQARGHLEDGIALYDPQQHRSLAFDYGDDPGVICLSDASWLLWHLGYPDQALQRSHEALTLAQQLAHPFSLAFALLFAAVLHQLRREAKAAQERAEAAIALATEHGFVHWLAMGTTLRGWALAELST